MSPAHRGIHSTAQVGAEVDANFHLAARNLDELTYTTVADLSVWDILKRKKLVLAADALPALYERLKELPLPPYTSSAVQSIMPSMLTLSLCGTSITTQTGSAEGLESNCAPSLAAIAQLWLRES